jgi:hypothetical protein
MNLPFKDGFRVVGGFLNQNSPTILTGLGVGGFITTVFLAVGATPKAMLTVWSEEEHRESKKLDPNVPLKDVVALTWRYYVPAVVMGTLTVGFIIGANSINLRRNAAIVSLYSITEATLKEYQAKVVETIGEKKEKAIRSEIAQDTLDKNPLSKKSVIVTGKGETLFYDTYSGRYFKSDIEKVRKVENLFNKELIAGYWSELNTLYHMLGLPSIEGGKKVGWNADKLLDLYFDAKLAENDEPCIVINYINGPSPTFRG